MVIIQSFPLKSKNFYRAFKVSSAATPSIPTACSINFSNSFSLIPLILSPSSQSPFSLFKSTPPKYLLLPNKSSLLGKISSLDSVVIPTNFISFPFLVDL